MIRAPVRKRDVGEQSEAAERFTILASRTEDVRELLKGEGSGFE
jgi:hypothetical protein